MKPAARAVLDLKTRLYGTRLEPDTTTKPDFVMQSFIPCSQDALWDALTDPAQMSAYHFLSPRITQDGEADTYRAPDGSTIMVTRTIKADPQTRIESTFEPHWEPEVSPSRSVFLIAPEPGHMKLVIQHYDLHFPVVPGEGVADGWARWAAGRKTYLETGETPRFNERGDAA